VGQDLRQILGQKGYFIFMKRSSKYVLNHSRYACYHKEVRRHFLGAS
jgi:hypothetical protein